MRRLLMVAGVMVLGMASAAIAAPTAEEVIEKMTAQIDKIASLEVKYPALKGGAS